MFYVATTDAGRTDLRAYGSTRDEAEKALRAGIEIHLVRLGMSRKGARRDQLIADISVTEFRIGGIYADDYEIGLANA